MPKASRPSWAILILIIWLGAVLRLWHFTELPPGLLHDVAFNGLDALQVIEGARPLYFEANNGREPLYIYLTALSVNFLGRNPLALRVPAALLGILFIPAVYALGRVLLGRRAGILAAFFAATSFWAVHVSRLGLRLISLPCLLALSLVITGLGWRHRRLRWVIGGGLVYGLTFYTHVASRVSPAAWLAFGLLWYLAKRSSFPSLRWVAAFVIPAGLVALPLLGMAVLAPGLVFGRSVAVSIFTPGQAVSQWGLNLLHNGWSVAGMFLGRGDANIYSNLPGRPVFDWFSGGAFLIGLGWLSRQAWRRQMASIFILVWGGVMLIPTLLSGEAPHFLRAIGIWPVLFLTPAIGWQALETWLGDRPAIKRAWIRGGLAALLGVSTGATLMDYFWVYPNLPDYAPAFAQGLQEMSAQINAYLGAGWTGPSREKPPADSPPRQVFLSSVLWEGPWFTPVRFLVPASPALHIFSGHDLTPLAEATSASIFLSCYDDPAAALNQLPSHTLVRLERGPVYHLGGETWVRPLFTRFTVSPVEPQLPAPLAEFEQALVLQAAQVLPTAVGWQVELVWTATTGQYQTVADQYHVFVHARSDSGAVLAQADGPVAEGLYPARLWQPGNYVVDVRQISLPAGVRREEVRFYAGVYAYASGERLRLQDGSSAEWELSYP